MAKLIKTLLVANRGEIAERIFRTCKKQGIKTIAVYSAPDSNSNYVKEADISVLLKGDNPIESHMDSFQIIRIAKKFGADAIHPGYGFLSENASFAKICNDEKIIFVGPDPDSIEVMGDKDKARGVVKDLGIPLLPGYEKSKEKETRLLSEAKKIGLPVLLKASAGGGGKGMRVVYKESEFLNSLNEVRREAKNVFGDDRIIIEKYIESGRHIEVQILGDNLGNVFHLFDRECTIQRRYQKIIEETPSKVLNADLRKEMFDCAIKIGRKLGYKSLGTVEFIYDNKTKKFFFLEVNTRIQVEHPVTEEITGIDLVGLQLKIAQGEKINLNQEDIKSNGYALEARLYAENPESNFLPTSGKIHNLKFPKINGIRIDSDLKSGDLVDIHFDPMLAKIIAHDISREKAINKLKYALSKIVLLGLITNIELLKNILSSNSFIKGEYNTNFIFENKQIIRIKRDKSSIENIVIIASLYRWLKRNRKKKLLKDLPSGWRNNFYRPQIEKFYFNGNEINCSYKMVNKKFNFSFSESNYNASIIKSRSGELRVEIDGILKKYHIKEIDKSIYIHSIDLGNMVLEVAQRYPSGEKVNEEKGYISPMPSLVVDVFVKKGDRIKKNQPLIVLSSMKMENTLYSNEDGVIEIINVAKGENIQSGHILLKIK
jgi:3-methylcrotonyl-CoA carboxylase alpha subunit